jgi:hypothetical protein
MGPAPYRLQTLIVAASGYQRLAAIDGFRQLQGIFGEVCLQLVVPLVACLQFAPVPSSL